MCSTLRTFHYTWFFFFFFNDTATTEIYTLSLHDALPILARQINAVPKGNGTGSPGARKERLPGHVLRVTPLLGQPLEWRDRKSTRLNSSHGYISYAVFCLKKKKKNKQKTYTTNYMTPKQS